MYIERIAQGVEFAAGLNTTTKLRQTSTDTPKRK